MNTQILSSVFSGFFLLLVTCGLSQDYDLIVTTKGDSIACRIDSITDTHIHYEMKSHNTWIHTQIPRSEVLEYEQGVINRREYIYKPGTTIIDSSKPAIPASMYHVRKNSVYIGMLSINYARMIPLGQNTGLTLGGGLINIDGWGVVAESSVLLGGVRHFLEPGIMGAYFFEPSDESGEEISAVTLRIGYRYQAPWGLLFRVAPNFIFSTEDSGLFYALSIGYSF
jgi:hypothetical protein